jgi:hypothetical protein
VKLLRHTADPGKDQGQWFTFLEADGERVRFRIRRVPEGKSREIEIRHRGRRTEVVHRRGEQVTGTDLEKLIDEVWEKARFALLDSERAEIEAADDLAAESYTKALGRPVKAGEMVLLDGAWTDAVKDLVFSEYSALVSWINERSQELGGLRAAEDAALGKT